MPSPQLTTCQKQGLEILSQPGNVFVTGAAGTGKSFLIHEFLKTKKAEDFPVLASTGTAALLLGGRTFHSFFGLGIMEGGARETIERASRNRKLKKRLKSAQGVIIDEVSMLSGATLAVAEIIARQARQNEYPWGGLKVVAVGDFAQLPPVNPHSFEKDWAFHSDVWKKTVFSQVSLETPIRTQDPAFLVILNKIRKGIFDEDVKTFLEDRSEPVGSDFDGTKIFPHRRSAEAYNLQRLEGMAGKLFQFETTYQGAAQIVERIKKNSPVPENLQLKIGVLIMLRQNDLDGRWVNGSLGHIVEVKKDALVVDLLEGSRVQVKRTKFTHLDADGNEVGCAHNYPVNLAYASTIHKTQGATLDRICVNLRGAWEHGQTYVALSRVRRSADLFIEGWSHNCIVVDSEVHEASLI